MHIRVRVAAVHKAFTPITRRQLPIGDGEPFQVDGSQEPQPIPQRAGVRHESGLHHPDLAQRAAPGHGFRPGVDRHRVGAHGNPGSRLRRSLGRQQDQRERQRRVRKLQSDSATAARPEVRLARRKSRFIRVMVSMLMSLGQASWHSA